MTLLASYLWIFFVSVPGHCICISFDLKTIKRLTLVGTELKITSKSIWCAFHVHGKTKGAFRLPKTYTFEALEGGSQVALIPLNILKNIPYP